MSISISELQNDLNEAISDFPTTFTINNVNYTGIVAAIDEQYQLTTGGDSDITAEWQIVCSKNIFTTIPAQRTKVTLDGKTYLIASVMKHPRLPQLVITLGSIK
jgi:hypothetical protein